MSASEVRPGPYSSALRMLLEHPEIKGAVGEVVNCIVEAENTLSTADYARFIEALNEIFEAEKRQL